MIIYVYPADNGGCGFYRLAGPAAALKAQGHDVRIIPPEARHGIEGGVDTRTGKLVLMRYPPDADVIVLQRVSRDHLANGIPMIRAAGVAVVVDMDDDLTKIDPANPAWDTYQVATGFRWHNLVNAHNACLRATLVTTSTPKLLSVYAPHGRGVVLRNCVPRRYLDVPRTDMASIGWPGSAHSHPRDLDEVGPAIERLVRLGHEYFGVGPRDGLAEALRLTEDQIEVTGNVAMEVWPEAVAQLGVGIAPLADTAFNEAKSWLKPLEMMACGVPWIGSPRAEYRKLRELTGVGTFADKPRTWFSAAKRLLDNESLRAEQSEAGRAAAAEYTIEGNAWRWAEAWAKAHEVQHYQNLRSARSSVA